MRGGVCLDATARSRKARILKARPLFGKRLIFGGTFALVHSRGRVHYLTMLQTMSHSDPGDLAKLGEFILDIRVALLTTVDRDGRFHARPVPTLKVEADRTLWFFTDWSSPKVDELHHDGRVSLGYADSTKNVYVAVTGSGRLIRDSQKAKELWSIEQRAYYPGGPEDERLLCCVSLSSERNIGSLRDESRI